MTGHQARERCSPSTSFERVVWQTKCHQQCAKVGIAKTQLTELTAVVADGFGRVIGAAHQDFLSGEHCFNGVLVCIDIEVALLVEVLQQVDGSQVARRVVDVHVFATWV